MGQREVSEPRVLERMWDCESGAVTEIWSPEGAMKEERGVGVTGVPFTVKTP